MRGLQRKNLATRDKAPVLTQSDQFSAPPVAALWRAVLPSWVAYGGGLVASNVGSESCYIGTGAVPGAW